ncbi:MAG: hypothetical protein ACI9CP_001884, partial [Cryomorphaceae bacterium]
MKRLSLLLLITLLIASCRNDDETIDPIDSPLGDKTSTYAGEFLQD